MRRRLLALLGILAIAAPASAFNQEYNFGSTHLEHGHGEMVRRGAAGTVFEAVADRLVSTQWELDFPTTPNSGKPGEYPTLTSGDLWVALVFGLDGNEQCKHFLRWWYGLPSWRTRVRPIAEDYQASVDFFNGEVRAAFAAEPSDEAIRRLGHAVHTLEDSFAPAHVERGPDLAIHDIHFYPSIQPHGHAVVADPGDRVVDEAGVLTPAASQAIAATHALLVGYAAVRQGTRQAQDAFLAGFAQRYFRFEP